MDADERFHPPPSPIFLLPTILNPPFSILAVPPLESFQFRSIAAAARFSRRSPAR
jgi:hypothetical protein